MEKFASRVTETAPEKSEGFAFAIQNMSTILNDEVRPGRISGSNSNAQLSSSHQFLILAPQLISGTGNKTVCFRFPFPCFGDQSEAIGIEGFDPKAPDVGASTLHPRSKVSEISNQVNGKNLYGGNRKATGN